MKAILIERPGNEEVLKLGDFAEPVPGPADLLINPDNGFSGRYVL